MSARFSASSASQRISGAAPKVKRPRVKRWIPDKVVSDGEAVEINMPIELVGLANARLHHYAKAKVVKSTRAITLAYVGNAVRPKDRTLPRLVKMTRHYTGRGQPMDEHDNLRMSFKPVVDAIASLWNVNDKDIRMVWTYAQARGDYVGVTIRIERPLATE